MKDRKASARILADKKNRIDSRAAELLRDFIERITGAKPVILPVESKTQIGDILIGNFQLPVKDIAVENIKKDGFALISLPS